MGRLETLRLGHAAIHEAEAMEIFAVGAIDPASSHHDFCVGNFRDVGCPCSRAAEMGFACLEIQRHDVSQSAVGIERVFAASAIERQPLGGSGLDKGRVSGKCGQQGDEGFLHHVRSCFGLMLFARGVRRRGVQIGTTQGAR